MSEKTTRILKKWIALCVLIGFLLPGGVLLVGCGDGGHIPDLPLEPRATAVSVVYASFVDFEPTPLPTPVLVPDDENCIACHTDEETLKETAEEVEEKETLSEGEG